MKQLIQHVNGYSLFAKVTNLPGTNGSVCVELTSTFDGARNPQEERYIHKMILSSDAKQRLISLLQSVDN